ncbi:MAG: prephenate dehydrogenase/arogenate dehydrogenase family protein [Candidatus Nanosalina sp.]
MIDQDIAIIGGTGKFGKHLAENLEDSNNILVTGRNLERAREACEGESWTPVKQQEAAERADVIIVSVPISVTVDVIQEIGPHISDDTLLCDVTSVKKKPVEAMKQYSNEVLGMHPMYAPSNSIKGQKIVLCPEEGKKWTEMEEFWSRNGGEIHVTEPEAHDKAMSIVQGLMHFSELVMAETIRKSDLEDSELEEYSTPIYQLLTDLTARMLNQKPGLYGSIQAENPENEEIRENFIESAEEIRELVGDEEEFAEKFYELGEEFNLEGAQERTDRVIEFLSNNLR